VAVIDLKLWAEGSPLLLCIGLLFIPDSFHAVLAA